MTPGKDEVILTRVLNQNTGEENLLLIFPKDGSETEALAQVSKGLDLALYERESSMIRSHWLDRLGGNPGHTYVVFRKIA